MKKFDLEATEENLKLTLEKDVLGRNSNLIMLAKLISNIDENIIISLDGKWGSGKTFFIKQFQYLIKNSEESEIINGVDNSAIFQKLKKENLVVYYNAWENDDHDNPLESLIYNILNEYPEQKDQLIDFGEFKKILKPFCRDLLKVVSGGLFDINNFDDMKSFKDLAESITTSEEKKKKFNKLINSILVDNQRLILIIDELDRCKPTFAVNMLETIKHFYNNDKITIIVSTNNLELSNTIKNFYGNDFNGYGYLNKFYDTVINLEVADIKMYLQNQLDFCYKTYLPHDMSYLILQHLGFSLRECNKYIVLYKMLRNYIEDEPVFDRKKSYLFSCLLLPLAIALKIKDIRLYNQFISKNGSSIIKNFLSNMVDNTDYEHWIKELIENGEKDYKEQIIEKYNSMFNSDGYSYDRFPFFDAISLLGTRLKWDDREE